jgi:PAS domain S-box-containing protein
MISEAPSGRVLYGNERMEQLLGHPLASPKNVEEYTIWRGFHPDGRPYLPHEWPLARTITTGEVVRAEEIHIERPDGTRLALLISASPVRDRLGKILAGIVVEQDITEHRQTLDALKISMRLETEARVEAETAIKFKDQFVAMVSHELRTPLNPVALSLAAMESDSRLPKDLQDEIAMVRRNIGMETKLIDDLLDVTSIANGKFSLDLKPTAMHALLREVIGIVEGESVARQQRVTLELQAQDDTVGGDAVRLQQVFWNVVKNAVKFAPVGGQIRIRTSNPGPAAIAIEVQDWGAGISADALPRIFGAFEQGHANRNWESGGLGLGLTICKAIVDLHGGHIQAASDGPGKGARFRVELPISRAIEKAINAPLRKPSEPSDSLRILVVEDHVDTLRVLRRLLESLGYVVATAGSAAAAMSYVAANDFDVLVSDIGLPDRSGLDLMRQLKSVRPVPAVAISGFGSAGDIQNSLDAGFCAHLTKPLDLKALHATIQRVTNDRAPERALSPRAAS